METGAGRMESPQYVPLGEVMEITGLKPRPLRDRIARHGLTVFQSGHDRRRLMLDRDDIPRLLEPIETNRRRSRIA